MTISLQDSQHTSVTKSDLVLKEAVKMFSIDLPCKVPLSYAYIWLNTVQSCGFCHCAQSEDPSALVSHFSEKL